MTANTSDTATGNETNVHVWYHCHSCEAAPIVGKRYQCDSCPAGPDNDLCEPCYQKYLQGKVKHPMEDSLASSAEDIKGHRFSIHEGKPISLYSDWLEVKHPAVPAPSIPYPFVVRPIFTAGMDSTFGSYAFAVKHEGFSQPILLTALHVMDQLIKQKGIDCSPDNQNYTGNELPSIITEVSIFNACAATWMTAPLGTAGPMLVLPNAGTGDEEPFSDRDIAAFKIPNPGELNAPPLALESPQKGDAVWQVARSEQPRQKLFKAVIVEITERAMVYKYEGPEQRPQYSSGSPIVNQEGEVVGITVGGGDLENQSLGHANHVKNIRKHLKEALSAG
jgi:hypothetical protein